METTEVILPEKFADKVRNMEVNEILDVTEKGKTIANSRTAALNQAKLAFPIASFKTQGHGGKVYLKRTA